MTVDVATADVERRDVVIVGGGIAGLTAAWRLRHRSILLLEASDRLGGRMRSDDADPYWLNFGAHLFPAPGSLVDTLARELDLETVPVWGGMMGLAMGRRKITSGPVESYPFRLPLSPAGRVAFALKGLQVQAAVRTYNRLMKARPGETPADVRARVLAYLDDRTFAEFLGRMPRDVQRIFSTASHRATAELDELAAGAGIGLFALVWAGKGSLIARNLLGGTGRLPAAMGVKLGDAARTRAEATSIREDGDGLIVEYAEGGSPRRVRVRHVVIAAQAPTGARLIADVAPDASAALAKMTYGAFLNVAVATRESGPMPWDSFYAMATTGRSFDMFTNQAHAFRKTGPRQPGGSLMLFAGGHHAAELIAASDEVISETFLRDLYDLYPEAKGIVAETRVRRWPLGNVFAKPGRHLLQAPIEGALGRRGNVHLAGDYFAELGNLEMAARTGAAAADRIESLLQAGPTSTTQATTEAVR